METPSSDSTQGTSAGPQFSISSSRVNGRWLVRVRGDLDLDSAADLEHQLLVPPVGASVVVDLSEVTLITARGIRMLLRDRRYGRPSVVCPPGHVRRVLSIVRAERVLAIYDDLAAAFAGGHPAAAARPAA